jgi:hypothetical protein
MSRLRRLRNVSLIPVLVLTLGGAPAIQAQTAGIITELPLKASTPFNVIGFIQAASLDQPGDIMAGGTVTVNGLVIVIPRNTILQMPAFTLTWAELFGLAPKPYGLGTGPVPTAPAQVRAQTGLALRDEPTPLATYEITIYGNRVIDRTKTPNTDHLIAGLVFLSQQSLNTATGHINYIDYKKGELRVGGLINDPNCVAGLPTCTGARVQINDPIGRFGIAHTPDIRFQIDEENPTVTAQTGFPMCIPRVAPTASGFDPLCPETNRPRDPATGNYLSVFTFPPPPAQINPATAVAVITPNPKPGDPPDATRQMPFEVGDYLTVRGTLVHDPALVNPATGVCTPPAGATTCPTVISATTIIAEMGVFTAPNTMPAYVAIDTMLLGVGGTPDPLIPIEAKDKLVVVMYTTDSTSLLDVYAIDVDNCTGLESDRFLGTGSAFGIPVAAVKGRALIRSVVGFFLPATREMRAVSRTLTGGGATASLFNKIAKGVTNTPRGNPLLIPEPEGPIPAGMHTYANGLLAGQYHAPNFTFIFVERLFLGQVQPPLNFQDFAFLVNGEGPYFPQPDANGAFPFGNPAGGFPTKQLSPWPGGVAVAAGCGPGTVTAMPIANAGAPQTVKSGGLVTLNGTGSTDPNTPPWGSGGPIYNWLQIVGPPVSLVDPTSPKPIFVAPIVPKGSGPVTLLFEMTVSNGVGSSGIASTQVTVAAQNFPPIQDTVFITAAVYSSSNSRLQVSAASTDLTGAAVLTLHVPGFPDTVMTNQPPVCINCAPSAYAARLFAVQLDPSITAVTVTSSEGGSASSRITRIR